MPVQCTCFVCGTTFSRVKSQVNERNYCSQKCGTLKVPVEPPCRLPDGISASIPLHHRDGSIRAHIIVDVADLDFVMSHRWHYAGKGYAARSVRSEDGKRRMVYLHRELLKLTEEDRIEVDHINRNTLDNRRSNMRTATHAENLQNHPGFGGSSTYRGVAFHKASGRWIANVSLQGVVHYLGYFNDEASAGDAARQARQRLMPYATD